MIDKIGSSFPNPRWIEPCNTLWGVP